jgi:hypothetical protein
VLGIGQSMDGCLTVVQQAHHRTYDGVGVLGYGVLQCRVPTPTGSAPILQGWGARDAPGVELNARRIEEPADGSRDNFADSGWAFLHDDVDRDLVRHGDRTTPWASPTYPGAVLTVLTPGIIAPEVAAIDAPVLLRQVITMSSLIRPVRCGPTCPPLDRPVRVPPHGPHAQLRRHPSAATAAPRQLGAVGCGAAAIIDGWGNLTEEAGRPRPPPPSSKTACAMPPWSCS